MISALLALNAIVFVILIIGLRKFGFKLTGQKSSAQWATICFAVVSLLSLAPLLYLQCLALSVSKTNLEGPIYAMPADPDAGAPKGLADQSSVPTWKWRIDQHAVKEYKDEAEKENWHHSTCGIAAVTSVVNFYGAHVTMHDVIDYAVQQKQLTRDCGLSPYPGMDLLTKKFGCQSHAMVNPSIDEIISEANAGRPVIALMPIYRYLGGHFMVVIGGDSRGIEVADSSHWNRKIVTRDWFSRIWDGKSAWVITKAQEP